MTSEQVQALKEQADCICGILENIARYEPGDIDGDDVEIRFETEDGFDTGCNVSIVEQCQSAADVIRSLLTEHDADKALIAEQREHISSLEEGVNMLLAQYDQLAAAMGWTTEKALAGEGNQEQYAESMVNRIAELEKELTDSITELSRIIQRETKLRREAEKQIAELEAHKLTVKLPQKVDRNDIDGWWMYKGRRIGGGAAEWYNKAIDDVESSCAAAGITLVVGE